MKVYLDGQFIDDEAATLSPFDAAFQHGIGLFETMHAYNGQVFRLNEHLTSLIESAVELGLTEALAREPLAEAVRQTLAKNELAEARVRLTITGGDMSLLSRAKEAVEGGGESVPPKHLPTVLIQATHPTVYPEAFFTNGVTALIADPKANPFDPMAGHKTINYWSRLRTLTTAAQKQAGEALWFSVSNHLCGGSVSNAFLVKDGKLITPYARGEEEEGALPAPVRPGVTRDAIMSLAVEEGILTSRRMVTIDDVLDADEIFLTNSSWLVLPVVAVEGQAVGAGEPGEVTRQLHGKLMDAIHAECPPKD
jgi:branched-subunit amino acid aminotransferase/4-amino-4-deoxychorismate lyase